MFIATEQFKMRMSPQRKKMLGFIAEREGRSKANVLNRLILERYEAIKANESPMKKQPAKMAMQ